MTIVTNKYQIGSSGTANNNFTIQTPNTPDGSLEIRRGNAEAPGAVLFKIDSANNLSFPNQTVSWKNVLASRTQGITYMNNTGQPIEVAIIVTASAGGAIILNVLLDGTDHYKEHASASWNVTATFTVPAGSTYSVSTLAGTMTLNTWRELRP